MQINEQTIHLGWISGMPRSGTTWLSQIFASCPDVRLKFCPLFSYEFKNILDEKSTAQQWEKLFTDVYLTKSEYLDQDYLRKNGFVPLFTGKNILPRNLFIKSNRFHNLVPHILALNKEIRFVHIVRHPCACIYSWLSNPLEFPVGANPILEWRSGQCRKNGPGEFWGFDDWLWVTNQAIRLSEKYPDRYRIIRYEDIVRDSQGETMRLFEYFKLPFGAQTQDFLKQSNIRHDPHRRSVFKDPNQVQSEWLRKLDPVIISVCYEAVKGTELEQFI